MKILIHELFLLVFKLVHKLSPLDFFWKQILRGRTIVLIWKILKFFYKNPWWGKLVQNTIFKVVATADWEIISFKKLNTGYWFKKIIYLPFLLHLFETKINFMNVPWTFAHFTCFLFLFIFCFVFFNFVYIFCFVFTVSLELILNIDILHLIILIWRL